MSDPAATHAGSPDDGTDGTEAPGSPDGEPLRHQVAIVLRARILTAYLGIGSATGLIDRRAWRSLRELLLGVPRAPSAAARAANGGDA